jgi:hypothetical protein
VGNVTLAGQRHIVRNRPPLPRGDRDPVKGSGTRLKVTFERAYPPPKPAQDGGFS